MKKILILGSNSCVAKDLIQFLSNSNFLYLVNRKDTKNNNKILKNKKIKFIHFKNLHKFKSINFDLIINCIATHNFSKNQQIIDYVNSNIVILLKILGSGIKAKQIINLSTISKLNLFNKKIVNEKTILNHETPLGITKACLDNLLKFQKIPYINLLLPGVVTSNNDFSRPFIKNLLHKINTEKIIKISNINSPFNSFIDVFELYRFIDHVLKTQNVSISNEFILCPSGQISLKAIISKCEKYYNKKYKIINLGYNKKHYLLSNNKLKKQIKYYPSTVNQILKRIYL